MGQKGLIDQVWVGIASPKGRILATKERKEDKECISLLQIADLVN